MAKEFRENLEQVDTVQLPLSTRLKTSKNLACRWEQKNWTWLKSSWRTWNGWVQCSKKLACRWEQRNWTWLKSSGRTGTGGNSENKDMVEEFRRTGIGRSSETEDMAEEFSQP